MIYASEVITIIQKKLRIILYNNITLNLSPIIFFVWYISLFSYLQKLECKPKIAIAFVNNKAYNIIILELKIYWMVKKLSNSASESQKVLVRSNPWSETSDAQYSGF
jgi:hypothetical protein